ncbi:hypothetical protein DPMN_149217 [Dreissena polymorpha]|uniref:Apple domain-containing protein n=1 Tax=Dreissena polymorpha TaxID=45954 RepID=A0A9D4FD66_DREPO|nr:hypothetical protein DPMN_149217 [Dreissena polymorpha]
MIQFQNVTGHSASSIDHLCLSGLCVKQLVPFTLGYGFMKLITIERGIDPTTPGCLHKCVTTRPRYRVKENSTLRNTYRRITDGERIGCVAECTKDPWCLSAVYDEVLRTCDLSSYSPDETMSQTEVQSGTRIYYQNVQELTAVAGIKAWQSSTMDAKNGSLAIDGSFHTTDLDCFHSQMDDGNYLIVELESMSNLVHVDILFRTDLFYDVRNREITVLVAHTLAELDTNQAKFCGHYNGPPADKYVPGRVKCAPNTTGKYAKFLQTIAEYLNICEVREVGSPFDVRHEFNIQITECRAGSAFQLDIQFGIRI